LVSSLLNPFQEKGLYEFSSCSVDNRQAPIPISHKFDTAFLDATRLPPGTPFFQFVQMTGFRQTIRQTD